MFEEWLKIGDRRYEIVRRVSRDGMVVRWPNQDGSEDGRLGSFYNLNQSSVEVLILGGNERCNLDNLFCPEHQTSLEEKRIGDETHLFCTYKDGQGNNSCRFNVFLSS